MRLRGPSSALLIGLLAAGLIGTNAILVFLLDRADEPAEQLALDRESETLQDTLDVHLSGEQRQLAGNAPAILAGADNARQVARVLLPRYPYLTTIRWENREGQVLASWGEARPQAAAVEAGFGATYEGRGGARVDCGFPVSGAEGGGLSMIVTYSLPLLVRHPHLEVPAASQHEVFILSSDGAVVASRQSPGTRPDTAAPILAPRNGLRVVVMSRQSTLRHGLLAAGAAATALSGGLGIAILRLRRELERRRRAQQAAEFRTAEADQANQLLTGLTRCQTRFIAGAPSAGVFDDLLETAKVVTGSEFGLIGETIEDVPGQPYLRTHALTEMPSGERTLELRNRSSIFGAALASGEVVIANDPGSDPRFSATPQGHPALRAFLGLPLLKGGQTVGLLALANRPGGYTEAEVARAAPLLATAATLIEAVRTTRAREEAECELSVALERALRTERDLRLREAAVQAAANAIVLCDRAGVVLWVNRAFTDLTGFPAATAVGRNLAILRSDEHDEAFFKQMWETILRGEVWQGEIVNRRRDGTRYIDETTITPLRDDRGEISHFVSIKQDVTWRHEAAKRLRESEERHRALVQGIGAIVWEADAQTFRFSFVSEYAERLLGYPVSAWLEEPDFWVRHMHPDDREWAPAFCAEATQRASPHSFDYRMIAADGSVVWLHDRVGVRCDPDGRPLILTGVMTDITQARNLKTAIKAAADQWTATFDAMESAVLLLGGDHGVLRMNKAAAALLQRGVTDVPGPAPWDGQAEEPWSTAQEVARQAGTGQAAVLRARDAQGRTWDVDATRVDAGSIVLGIRDVTRMVELEDTTRRAEHLATLGALVAGVAHEVRNPLFALSVNIDALAAELGGRPNVDEMLDALREERDRLNRLMEDLLHFGRPAPAERELATIGPVLAAAASDCGALARRSKVEIVVRDRSGASLIQMNPGRLQEVFANLLENACQHARPHGRVAIDVAPFDEDGRPWLRCTLQDDGPGFSSEALRRAFEPFFTGRRGGTGLGLAIVERFTLEHGGRVCAANAPDGGGILTVDLPVAKPSPASP